MKKNIRMSNLEILRIVSILLIISFHYAFKGEFDFSNHLTMNKMIVKTFYMFGELGVNCFVLISGYFMVDSKFKGKKLIQLILQVAFYTILTTIFSYHVGYWEISTLRHLAGTIFPVIFNKYWFITAYIILYILSPYLNKLINSINKDDYKKMLFILLTIFCVIPTFFGAIINNTEGLLYYNRLIWLIIMYLIGAYIKRYKLPISNTLKKSLILSTISFGILLASILVIEKFDSIFNLIGVKEVAYLWTPNNIIMLLLSIGLFGVFENIKVPNNNIINKISSTTLGIYLLHDGVLAYWFWRFAFKNSTYQESPYLILQILKATFIIFVVGMIIDLVRQLIEKYTVNKILESKIFNELSNKVKRITNNILKIEKNNEEVGEKMKKKMKKAENKKQVKIKENKLDRFTDKIFENKIIRNLLVFMLSASFSLLSFYQIIKYERIYTIITLIVTFILSFIFITKTVKENYKYYKENKIKTIIILILSIFVILAMHESKIIKQLNIFDFKIEISRLRYWALATPAVFYLFVWIYRKIKDFITKFWKDLDDKEKKIYKKISIISTIVVAILFVLNNNWYTQYDIVYSIDSGWIFKNMLPKLAYYDLRHPILGTIMFPLWAMITKTLGLVVPAHLLNTCGAIFFQVLSVQFLIIISFIIKKLTSSDWAFKLYLVSAPTLLFALFLEKYQLITFMLVVYVYLYMKNNENKEEALVMAAGIMPTSIFIYIKEFFSKEPIKQKIKNIMKLAVVGLGVIICLGRVHMLFPNNLMQELELIQTKYASKEVTKVEALTSYTNMVEGSLLTVSSKVNKKYIWTGILDEISYIGVAMFIIMLIGIIKDRKDKFTQICSIWLVFSILLLTVLNWSVHESPLFSIYFSWAFIPLFVKGLDYLINKFNIKEKNVYYPIIGIVGIINIINMINIFMFFN